MIVIVTCNGYTQEASLIRGATLDDAVEVCRVIELQSGDGFARVASERGRIVADADGLRSECEGLPPFDAATATGMYDGW